jgi:hypothetical protein
MDICQSLQGNGVEVKTANDAAGSENVKSKLGHSRFGHDLGIEETACRTPELLFAYRDMGV